jgi:hypothetical protein
MGGVAVAAVVLVAAIGCGGNDARKAHRDEVEAYLTGINRTEAKSGAAFRRASAALTAWASGKTTPQDERRLAAAIATIEAGRASVAALPWPPQAAGVRRDILELYERQATLAREVRELTRYSAATRRTLERTRSALRARTSHRLNAVTLAGYARTLGRAARDLSARPAPAVLAPWADAQVTWFRNLAAEARRLASAVSAGDAEAARITTIRYRMIADARPAVTPAQRRAVVAYNARVDAIERLRARIAAETAALDKSLQ